MKLGVIILRNTYYKFLGPVVEAALGRGWQVTCWHYENEQFNKSPKGYQRPSADPFPAYGGGTPQIVEFQAYEQLPQLAAEVDCVVSIHGPSFFKITQPVVWVNIQHFVDFFIDGLDNVLSADLTCYYSEFWIEWACSFYKRLNKTDLPAEQLRAQLRKKAAITGYVELDALMRIDPAEVRRKWGVPSDKPVVTYLNNAHAQLKTSLWGGWIHSETSRFRQLFNMARHPSLLRYLPSVVRGWNDKSVITAVRRFCDRNNAFLIAKCRKKVPPRHYEEAAVDLVLYDESYYPPTFLEVMAISDLVIADHSSTVTQSIPSEVPHILIDFGPQSRDVSVTHNRVLYELLEEDSEPAVWQADGVIFRMKLGDLLRDLPYMRFRDFQTSPEVREQYTAKLLGFRDGRNAERVLDAIVQNIRSFSRKAM